MITKHAQAFLHARTHDSRSLARSLAHMLVHAQAYVQDTRTQSTSSLHQTAKVC